MTPVTGLLSILVLLEGGQEKLGACAMKYTGWLEIFGGNTKNIIIKTYKQTLESF